MDAEYKQNINRINNNNNTTKATAAAAAAGFKSKSKQYTNYNLQMTEQKTTKRQIEIAAHLKWHHHGYSTIRVIEMDRNQDFRLWFFSSSI